VRLRKDYVMTTINEQVHDLEEQNADFKEELDYWRSKAEKMEERALHAEALCEAAVEGLRVYHEHVNAKQKNNFFSAWEGTE
jgi:hypothetical protein